MLRLLPRWVKVSSQSAGACCIQHMCALKLGVLGPCPDYIGSSNLRCVVMAGVVPLYKGARDLLARFVEEVACYTFCLAIFGLMIHSLMISPLLACNCNALSHLYKLQGGVCGAKNTSCVSWWVDIGP